MRRFQIRIGSYEVNAVIRDPGRRVSAFSRAVIPGCLPGLIKSAGIAYERAALGYPFYERSQVLTPALGRSETIKRSSRNDRSYESSRSQATSLTIAINPERARRELNRKYWTLLLS